MKLLSVGRFCLGIGILALCHSVLVAQQTPPPQISPLGDTTSDQPRNIHTATPPAGAAAPVNSSSYKVGPGDILNIDVWHQPEFSGLYTVHSDGKITLKLVGDLDAGSRTPDQIQESVAKALLKYVKNPLVTVTVQEVFSKKYYMDGLTNRPGEYQLTTPTTILEAISRAGGLQEFANPKKIYILRGDKRIPFNYKEVIRGKNLAQNIQLQPGDHIVVP